MLNENLFLQCQPGPVKLLKFKFKRDQVPPFVDEEYVGCAGCDTTLKDMFQMSSFGGGGGGTTSTQRSQPPDSGYNSTSGYSSTQSSRNNSASGYNSTQPSRNNSAMGAGFNSTQGPTRDTPIAAGTVVCTCGADARLLTVRKEGPNQGILLIDTSQIYNLSC